MCPAIKTTSRVEGFVRCFLGCFSCCCPGLALASSDPLNSTDNLEYIKYFTANPYIYHGKARLGTIESLLIGMRGARNLINRVSIPFTVIQGSADRLVDPKSAQALYKGAPTEDKALHMYEGLGHGIMYDKEVYEICSKLQEWISNRF